LFDMHAPTRASLERIYAVKLVFRILVAAAFVVAAVRADAQTIPGLVLILPASTADFTASSDHAAIGLDGAPIVAGYRASYHLLDAASNPVATPAFVVDLAKPAPVGGVIVIPNAFGSILPNTAYRMFVEAYGPGGVGVSPVSVPFGKAAPKIPAAPSQPRISQ
jgi:hypothetical protein